MWLCGCHDVCMDSYPWLEAGADAEYATMEVFRLAGFAYSGEVVI